MAIIDVRVQIGSTPIWGNPFTQNHLARMMEKYGIERSIVSSTIANTCDFIRGNAEIKQITDKTRVLGCVVVNTQYPTESVEDMRQYMSSSAFAGLLLRSGTRGKPVTLDEADHIVNSHRRFLKPIFLEVTDRPHVLAADEIAKAFPGMKVVLLSMGGDAWRTAITAAEKTLNLVLEVSGSLSPDKISLAAEAIGAHRLVYGSNLPFADPAVTVGLVEDADISDADKKMILAGSAKRLFGWERSEEDS